jgi:hypothetical protein
MSDERAPFEAILTVHVTVEGGRVMIRSPEPITYMKLQPHEARELALMLYNASVYAVKSALSVEHVRHGEPLGDEELVHVDTLEGPDLG